MRVAIPPLPQYVFMAWCLITLKDNFTFTFARTPSLYHCQVVCDALNKQGETFSSLIKCFWRNKIFLILEVRMETVENRDVNISGKNLNVNARLL
jgi:hypothetical protein